MIRRLNCILTHKNVLTCGVLFVFLLSLKYYFLPIGGDELKYYELAQNIKYNGKYFYQDCPNTFIPTIPFLILLFDTPSNPMLGIVFAKLFVFAMLVVGLFYANKVFELALIDRLTINLILLGVMFNPHVIRWTVTLYPDIIAFGLFWFIIHRILLYNSRKNISAQNWFILVLFMTILVLVKYVYVVLYFWVVYIWIDKIKYLFRFVGFRRTFISYMKHNIAIMFALIPLVIWIQYLIGVDFGSGANESGFSQFKNTGENVLIRNLKKGLGFIPMENGKFNGIPAFINNFIPKVNLRDWYLSVFSLFIVLYGLIINVLRKTNRTYAVLLITLFLVMLSFIVSGTGFSRYWLPLFPIFYLGIRETFKLFLKHDTMFTYFVVIGIFFYILNEIRLIQVVIQSLKS